MLRSSTLPRAPDAHDKKGWELVERDISKGTDGLDPRKPHRLNSPPEGYRACHTRRGCAVRLEVICAEPAQAASILPQCLHLSTSNLMSSAHMGHFLVDKAASLSSDTTVCFSDTLTAQTIATTHPPASTREAHLQRR